MTPATRNCRKKGADPGSASQPQPGAEDSARARATKSWRSPDCWGSKLYRSWGNYKWNHWRQHWQDSPAGWPSWDISNITIAGTLKAITKKIVKYLRKVKQKTHHCQPDFEEYVFLPIRPTLPSWIWLLLMWKLWWMQIFQNRTWIQHSHNEWHGKE